MSNRSAIAWYILVGVVGVVCLSLGGPYSFFGGLAVGHLAGMLIVGELE